MIGILNIDKPPGMTSRDVVNRVAKLVKPAKAGHAGTLDPMATGVLLVCVGGATRLISDLQSQTKVYRSLFEFGKTSDTDDITGTILSSFTPPPLPRENFEALLKDFTGQLEQVPPRFSAVHVEGQRAYDLARNGKSFELQAKTVEVHRMTILRYDFPRVELEIECGSGTYIRSLARDLGAKLGCGGLMRELTRTRIGCFTVEAASSLEELTKANLASDLHSPLQAIPLLPRYFCSEEAYPLIRQGRAVELRLNFITPTDERALLEGQQAALVDAAGNLLAVATFHQNPAQLAPRMVFLK